MTIRNQVHSPGYANCSLGGKFDDPGAPGRSSKDKGKSSENQICSGISEMFRPLMPLSFKRKLQEGGGGGVKVDLQEGGRGQVEQVQAPLESASPLAQTAGLLFLFQPISCCCWFGRPFCVSWSEAAFETSYLFEYSDGCCSWCICSWW